MGRPVSSSLALMAGGGNSYRQAEPCPVATGKYGDGEDLSHQGDPTSFLVALATVQDGSAAVRLALWRCVFCGAALVGIGTPDDVPELQVYTWFESADD